MRRSSIGRRTSDGTTAAAAIEIISAGVCFVRELQISLAAATATTLGVGRPAAAGITPTSPVTSLLEGVATDASKITTAVAWGTGPTVPASFFRRVGFPATIGSQILWQFKDGIYLSPGQTLVVWNLASNGVIDVTVVVDEQ
jgi:hypothetical protein